MAGYPRIGQAVERAGLALPVAAAAGVAAGAALPGGDTLAASLLGGDSGLVLGAFRSGLLMTAAGVAVVSFGLVLVIRRVSARRWLARLVLAARGAGLGAINRQRVLSVRTREPLADPMAVLDLMRPALRAAAREEGAAGSEPGEVRIRPFMRDQSARTDTISPSKRPREDAEVV